MLINRFSNKLFANFRLSIEKILMKPLVNIINNNVINISVAHVQIHAIKAQK